MMDKQEKVIKGLECRLDINGSKYKHCLTCDYRHDIDHCQWACQTDGILEDALVLLKAQEPRVMTLEAAKEARICWIEERDVGIVYPAIYECIGNPSKCGQFSVFTVVSDADILPEEFDDEDDLVRSFEEGRRWLWEADYNDVWRCWTSRPTDEQKEATPWNECTKVNCPMQAGTKTDNCGENCPWRTTAKIGDLISRAAAIAEIEEYIEEYSELEPKTGYHNLKWCAMEEAKDVLSMLPAVDAVPVVHGKWIRHGCVKTPQYDKTTDLPSYAHRCSTCDRVSYFPTDYRDSYCRHCGAKMDGLTK